MAKPSRSVVAAETATGLRVCSSCRSGKPLDSRNFAPRADCEFDITTNTGQRTDACPSLDRFVPKLGYVEGNVSLICWRCNNLKRDATADELEAVVKWMRGRMTSRQAISVSATCPKGDE